MTRLVDTAVRDFLQGQDFSAKALTDFLVIPYPPDEQQIALYINASRESPACYDGCIKFIEKFAEDNQPIPRQLIFWALDVLRGRIAQPKKRGQSKYAKLGRDATIHEAVEIASKYGLTVDNSCALVSKILIDNFGISVGKEAVVTIWKNRKK